MQVLGCSKPKIPKQTQVILLISDGKFHAISLALETNLPVYIYNNQTLEKISQKQIDSMRKSQKSAYVNYLNANSVGILISTKPGQQNLNKALNLSKQLKNKEVYLFICNNIDIKEFENFPQIQSWVNTACPRIDMASSKIVNSRDIN